ncbi:hypothetical protein P9A10_16365 [Serratia marcescens]|uniref:hypothetical protein n=1 Tax=Serratia marcescens TaxID=615 RepID=UPI0032047210
MKDIVGMIEQIHELVLRSDVVTEESYRLTLKGCKVTNDIAKICDGIGNACSELDMLCPTIMVSGSSVDSEEVSDYVGVDDSPWSILISKNLLADALKPDNKPDSKNVLFLCEARALDWVKTVDPFAAPTIELAPDFSQETFIWIYGLEKAFGGPCVNVLPVNKHNDINQVDDLTLPNAIQISESVKISSDTHLKIRPNAFLINWGDLTSDLAKGFIALGIDNLIASLAFEVKRYEGKYTISFKGTKLVTKTLDRNIDANCFDLQRKLIKTVSWAYKERSETRLQLIMDRLSLDIEPEQSIYEGLSLYIDEALQQAQDSYAFVILDRKDAYHKEMRELLKDMRSQADMYASKVRDLISNITRDILGILAFVGFSFLSKFDKKNLMDLLDSHELSILVKFLAGYLLLSCILQISAHWRDSFLSTRESQRWLKVLQRYTSREENSNNFLQPINSRKNTLYFSFVVMVLVYVALFITTWNLPAIAKYFLV